MGKASLPERLVESSLNEPLNAVPTLLCFLSTHLKSCMRLCIETNSRIENSLSCSRHEMAYRELKLDPG